MVSHSSEALALGDRLRSISRLSEYGTPIGLNKQMLSYYWKAKKEQGSQVNDSLLLEAVESLSAPLVQYHSNPIVGFATAQVKPVPMNTNPIRGILRRGFLNPSPREKGISLLSLSRVVKDDEIKDAPGRSAILDEAFGFGGDQEDDGWDGDFFPRSP